MTHTHQTQVLAQAELQDRMAILVTFLVQLDQAPNINLNDLNQAITLARSVRMQQERCDRMYHEYLLQRYEAGTYDPTNPLF